MSANTYGRQVVLPLTNKSGGGVVAGDVVVVDTTNNDAFTTTTSAGFTGGVGIAQETIASNAVGRVLLSGYAALVNVNASVTRGHFGKTHTVAKQATDAGATRGVGTFCQFLTGGATPDAVVYPVDLLGSSLTNPMTTTGDIIYSSDNSGTPARLAATTSGYLLTAQGAGTAPAWAAPAASGAMVLIASSVLGSPAASFSFTSISGSYNHLRLIICARVTGAVFDGNVQLQFNADTGGNYDRVGQVDTTIMSEVFAGTSGYVGTAPGASGPANIPGLIVVEIPCYALTTFHKSAISLGYGLVGQSTGNDRKGASVITWRNTAAITRVDVILTTGTTFATGSAAYLYGIT